MTNRIFVDIDTQVDFVSEEGNLPVPGAEDIRPQLYELSQYARTNNIPTIKTGDWHTHKTEEIVFDGSEDMMKTFPPHCMMGRPGAEFIEETTWPHMAKVQWGHREGNLIRALKAFKQGEPLVLYKDRFNVFDGTRYADFVFDHIDPEEAVVFGVSGNVCVMHAINGLLDRGVDVIAVEDAIASLPAEGTLSSWKNLKAKWYKEAEDDPDFGDFSTTTTSEVIT